MDEFGQRTDDIIIISEEANGNVVDKEPPPKSPLSPPPRLPGSASPRSESPAPFSQYTAPTPLPEIRVIRPSTENQNVEVAVKEEVGGGGCCKCVIM